MAQLEDAEGLRVEGIGEDGERWGGAGVGGRGGGRTEDDGDEGRGVEEIEDVEEGELILTESRRGGYLGDKDEMDVWEQSRSRPPFGQTGLIDWDWPR
ncbi:hypothetical protein Dda_3498 [Drechslerella dactyloides]|uniref:Uncharacterized protein n=1 Tax=Drechslerella dactyloides TaxID=74499 RepID=A0AAD6IYW4_DREDA|nr:hypothetical protein Dda_3498 [Drechslerella dactyloides]